MRPRVTDKNRGPADLAARFNFKGENMSTRTTDKKRHTVKVTFAKKTPERDLLWKVYRFVLKNWAVGEDDIVKATKLDVKEVKRLTRKLARTGLLAGTHVNDEKAITWQTYFDVENDNDAVKNGTAAFNEVYPKGEPVKEPVKTPARNGATGHRYTKEQLEKARDLRLMLTDGDLRMTWKEIADAVGVKSPHHFSKVLRAEFPKVK